MSRITNTAIAIELLVILACSSLMAQNLPAPSFEVSDLKGNHYSLEELRGKIVVLNFWFVQCKPCVMEMPDLNDLVKKYQGKDVVFLAFAANDEKELKRFLEKEEFTYHIIPDSQTIAEKYFVHGYPTHVVVDARGHIAHNLMGLNPFTVKRLDQKIETLLGN